MKIETSISFSNNVVPSPVIEFKPVLIESDVHQNQFLVHQIFSANIAYKEEKLKLATLIIRSKSNKCTPCSDRLRKVVNLVNVRAAIDYSSHETLTTSSGFKLQDPPHFQFKYINRPLCRLVRSDYPSCEMSSENFSCRMHQIIGKKPKDWIVKVLYLWGVFTYDDLADFLPLPKQLIKEGLQKCVDSGLLYEGEIDLQGGFALNPSFRNKLMKSQFMGWHEEDKYFKMNQFTDFSHKFFYWTSHYVDIHGYPFFPSKIIDSNE